MSEVREKRARIKCLAFFRYIFCWRLAVFALVPAGSMNDFGQIARQVSHEFSIEVGFRESAPYGRDKVVALFELANGLDVLIMEDHSAPLLSYQTWFKVGSSFEKKGHTGIAHLFEHLMFKGTKQYPHEVFDRLLEQAGAQTNAATWLDWTFYYENLPATQLELAARLESDRMQNLILTEEQLASEREVVKNERRLRVDNDPDGKMDEALFELLFPNHPYGRPTIGYMEDLDRLTLEEIIQFYRTYYSASNATLVIVGDVKVLDVLRTVLRYYGHMPRVEVPPNNPEPEAEQSGLREVTLFMPVATEKAKIAFRAAPATSDDQYALEVVNEILFTNESSRVHKLLVEEMGLASEVDGGYEPLSLYGVFIVDLVLNEGKDAGIAVNTVLTEMERLADEGPTQVELERARNRAEASFRRALSTIGSRATQLGVHHVTAGDFKRLFRYVNGVSAVTPEDVRRVVSLYLTRSKACVVYGKLGK